MAPKKEESFSSIVESFRRKEYPPKVLIVGQTGAGKTTLLNFLAGFRCVTDKKPSELPMADVLRLQNSRFNRPELEGVHAAESGQSQTNKASAYDVSIAEDVNIVVIDTPGFADTEGLEKDESHEKVIVDLLKEAEYLNCILLVINGTATRLQSNIAYTMARIASLMPRDILSNVVIVYTFVDSKATCKFPEDGLEYFKVEGVDPPRFYIQNPLGPLVGYKQSLADVLERAHWSDSEDEGDGKQMFRDVVKGSKAAKRLLSQISKFECCPTDSMVELKESKDRIEALLINLIEKAKAEARFQGQLVDLEERIKAGGMVEYELDKPGWQLQEHPSYHYYCQSPGCHCSRNYDDAFGSKLTLIWEWIKLKASSPESKSSDCDCDHCNQDHTQGKRRWMEVVEKVKWMDEKASDKDARAQLQETLVHSKLMVAEVRAKFTKAVEAYQRLGLPDAFRRLMRAQETYLKDCIEAKEAADAEDLLKMLDTVTEMIKWAGSASDGIHPDS